MITTELGHEFKKHSEDTSEIFRWSIWSWDNLILDRYKETYIYISILTVASVFPRTDMKRQIDMKIGR